LSNYGKATNEKGRLKQSELKEQKKKQVQGKGFAESSKLSMTINNSRKESVKAVKEKKEIC